MNNVPIWVIAIAASVITGGILILIPIYFSKKERDKDITILHHGVNITLSEQEYNLYKQEKIAKLHKDNGYTSDNEHKLVSENKKLNEKVRNSIKRCNDRLSRKVLMEIIDIPVNTKKDLDYKTWLFNNGNLRTNDEVMEYDYRQYCKKHRDNYNTERHTVNFVTFFIPFIVVFLITFLGVNIFRELWFLGIPIALIPSLIAGIIGSIIGNAINISNAKEYGISENDPAVKSEKTKLVTGIISATGSTGYTIHKVKDAVKGVANVDSWNEFK